MANFLSPVLNEQLFDANGDPLAGGLIYTYLAGTVTPVTTYKTVSGTAHTNPIVLDSSGNYPTGTQLWLEGGRTYKFVVQNSTGVTLRTIDNISPINDTAESADEWIQYTASAFTYISGTSFSVVGDQTNLFQANRRVRTTNTGGTVYSTVVSAIYSAPNTTVTLANDSGNLDSGLSAVFYSILSAQNPSLPKLSATYWQMSSARVLARSTAGTGPVEELTAAQFTAFLSPSLVLPRGHIDGLTLSTAGASTTMTVAAGQAMDSTNTVALVLAASISKTTAAWTVGSGVGGLDTGAIANSTWYYWYLIRRPDTGVVDVIFSLSSSAPTLPANYTQYRYIGGALTNGSGQWVGFFQSGDEFTWAVPVSLDINTTTLSTTQTSFTVSVPRGRAMTWIAAMNFNSSGNVSLAVGNPLQTLGTPNFTNGDLYQTTTGGTQAVPMRQLTNTTAQIALVSSAASTTVRARTLGWIDTRGRNA